MPVSPRLRLRRRAGQGKSLGMNNRTALLALALTVAPLAGCGTILGYGRDQTITVHTDPQGADLYVNSVPANAKSPAELSFDPAKDGHRVDARLMTPRGEVKNGTSIIKKTRLPVVLLDAFLTGGLGLVVDYITGALYSFEPRVSISMPREPLVVPPPPPPQQQPDRTGPQAGTGQTRPEPPPGPRAMAPCFLCNEPRGEQVPCPHCGVVEMR